MSQDIKVRLGGLLAIAIGIGAGWFFVWQPLQAAQSGAPEVSYQLKAFVLVPFCLVFGLAFVVMGSRFEYRNAEHTNLTVLGWVLFVLGAVLTAAGFVWFQQQFAALGYT